MEKLNRKELVDRVAERAHLSKRDAKESIDALIDIIVESLDKGVEVNLTNFGVFTPKVRKDREGTDPKTHERIKISGKKTVSFRLSKTYKVDLNK